MMGLRRLPSYLRSSALKPPSPKVPRSLCGFTAAGCASQGVRILSQAAKGLRAEGLKAEGQMAQGFRGRQLAGWVSGFHSRGLRLECYAAMIPHPDKPRGEDAYFTLPGPEAKGSEVQAAGVADGVGGWSDIGVDAGEYSRALMKHASARLVSGVAGGCPVDALAFADTMTRVNPHSSHTSSTVANSQASFRDHEVWSSEAESLRLNARTLNHKPTT
mmetsp:Transcript_48048/g.75027  ORF Transcript_48048/g.75027 Transcript_48048/m.75027 type:complete len:217 (-) Transcript_48048:685-1335(-)